MIEGSERTGRLPNVDEISDDLIYDLRAPNEPTACVKRVGCEKCREGLGTLIGQKCVELYSIHYLDTVDVYACEHCGSIWWEHVNREQA